MFIPKQNPIYAKLEDTPVVEDQRPYIGMSSLGHPCQRKIWYDFHWAYKRSISQRLRRIFRRGDMEEQLVYDDLRDAGMEVTETQKEIVDDTGHVKGHIDGLVCCVPGAEKTRHLLEIKTMNKSRFNAFVKSGCDLKQTDPGYYVQMNQYMGHLKINRCLYVVTNKDNEERIYHRYDFDEINFHEYKKVGFDVLTAESAPGKIGEITWITCKMCDAKEVCHKGAKIDRNCRTCKYVEIAMNGVFKCGLDNGILPENFQRQGCDKYKFDEEAFK